MIGKFKDFIKEINYKNQLKNNKKFHNLYQGEDIYILANGPSLNKIPIEFLQDKKLIVMNHFEFHPLALSENIVAHCIGEPYNSDTWEDPHLMLSGVRSKYKVFRMDALNFFKNKKNSFDIHYYLPTASKNQIKYDMSKAALHYQSTSQMAILLAIYMGFKNIYLAGFDHDWLVNRNVSPHYYEENDSADVADLGKWRYIDIINASLNLFNKYYDLRDIAEKCGINIINISEGSYLDVFPIMEVN